MIQQKWVTREVVCTDNLGNKWFDTKDVLQYRQTSWQVDNRGDHYEEWSEWKDVPHEEEK